ncbi:hypothetical protein GQ53DRAFT_831753 [Thozetella sp. PMI_491]|nr:hypothetical protein GQ53DRAFT_831753 [Thozetella sp. PMI_491]
METGPSKGRMPADGRLSSLNVETATLSSEDDLGPRTTVSEESSLHSEVPQPVLPDGQISPAASEQDENESDDQLVERPNNSTDAPIVPDALSTHHGISSSPASTVAPLTSKQKLGMFAIIIFSVGTAIILTAVGILWFLWAAGESNSLW